LDASIFGVDIFQRILYESQFPIDRYLSKAQKPIPRVPKFTLKALSQENEGGLAQSRLIMSHDQVALMQVEIDLRQVFRY